MLRTVYLPNERAEALVRAVADLNERFQEFRAVSAEQMQVRSPTAEWSLMVGHETRGTYRETFLS